MIREDVTPRFWQTIEDDLAEGSDGASAGRRPAAAESPHVRLTSMVGPLLEHPDGLGL